MTKVVGIANTAVTLEARHLPIEDGDILIFTLPEHYTEVELVVAKQTCQQLRDELQAMGKTVSTVIIIENWKLETATRASILDLYGRLGIALMPPDHVVNEGHPDQEPQVWLTGAGPEQRYTHDHPERRSQRRPPAAERRKVPRTP